MAHQPFAVADYAQALKALMPRGRVWPRDPDSIQSLVLTAFAAAFNRSDITALALLIDAFPSTAVALLPEWEATLGLPDPCCGPATTIQGRQQQVLARFLGGGGQSVPYFITLAATLGFTVTIQEFTGTTALANTWQVTVPGTGITFFRAGVSAAGEPLETVVTDSQVLQCVFNRLKPAHTILIWNFV
ncbi:MAG: DUF2313 domain-containing protein [Caulobacteraceae bacterium]|nr:DUF2313 domain-containing protein [Caulobacteraceae bacterium]